MHSVAGRHTVQASHACIVIFSKLNHGKKKKKSRNMAINKRFSKHPLLVDSRN